MRGKKGRNYTPLIIYIYIYTRACRAHYHVHQPQHTQEYWQGPQDPLRQGQPELTPDPEQDTWGIDLSRTILTTQEPV